MSNILGFTVARRTSRCNLLAGWLAGGSIRLYTTDRPANADTAISTQTLLVTFTLANPSGSVTNGVFTGTLPDSALIAETGTPAWGRILDTDDVVIGDCDVGVSGSGSFVEIDHLSLVEGGYCSMTAFGITER
jgi:hypothetical protein